MKWLVWLLVLLNVALLGYFQLSGMQAESVRQGHEPVLAEQMTLLSKEQLAAMTELSPGTGAGETTVPLADALACYEWGSFPAASVPRARSILEQLGLEFTVHQTAATEAIRYWVYIPPLKSQQEAEARSDALRLLGVAETFVVEEARWRNAISLGIFSDKTLATRLAQELRSRGVLDVVSEVRNQGGGQSSFLIRELSAARAEGIGAHRPDFPYMELKQVACQ